MDNPCLFVYRFHPHRIPLKKGIFKHFFKHVTTFSNQMNGEIKFVVIADNTTEEQAKDIFQDSAKELLAERVDFSTVHVPWIPRPKPPEEVEGRFPGRKLPNGEISYRYKNNLFTHCISSMDYVKKNVTDDSTVIFFCEDDYIYKDNALIKAYRMQCDHPDDFVSLYDCPTLYKNQPGYRDSPMGLVFEHDHHWWTGGSACLTYIATMNSLKLQGQWALNDGLLCWGSNRLWKGIYNNGKSILWISLPSLVFHYYSINFDTADWKPIKDSIV